MRKKEVAVKKLVVLVSVLGFTGIAGYVGVRQVEGRTVDQSAAGYQTRAIADATMHVHTIYRDPTNDYGVKFDGAE